jgi:signal transduction histidine kinase
MGLLIGLLRRRPLAALVLMLAGSVVVVGAHRRTDDVLFLPFLGVDLAVGYIFATRTLKVSTTAVTLSLSVQLWVIAYFRDYARIHGGPAKFSYSAHAAVTIFGVLAMAVACMVGMLISERRGHAASLRARAAADAVTAERLRIARELHDMVAHSIGVIAIQAGVGGRVMQTQPDETRKALQAIETISQATLTGLQQTLGALRETETENGRTALGTAAGLAAVDRLALTTRDAGVRVEVQWRGERRPVPADVDLSAFRIIQEAVTNVVKHSGTSVCRVTVDYRQEELAIEVTDPGCRGRDCRLGRSHDRDAGGRAGYGIVGMRERVSLLQGDFDAGPMPGGGFRVAARLPAPAPAPAGACR